jgi:hypothetical protein
VSAPLSTVAALRARYGTLDAYAGARLVTLGEGSERGVRVLEMRSGGGLEFEIVVDRGFDIGRLALDGVTLSWHSANGLRGPWLSDAASDRGQGYLRQASGFLATCGFDHIRQPETDRADAAPLHPDGEVDYPLHGRGTGQPARLVGHGIEEEAEAPFLWAEGEIVEAMTFLGALRLRRRITVPLGGTSFSIEDRIDNVGPFVSTHMLLYHFNIGYPLVDAGARIDPGPAEEIWRGPDHIPLAPFTAASPRHSADLSIFRMQEDRPSVCRVTGRPGFGLAIGFEARQLPFLQLLRMGGTGLYGIGIEPCTTGVRSRREARETGQMIMLEPGEARDYRLTVSLTGRAAVPKSL